MAEIKFTFGGDALQRLRKLVALPAAPTVRTVAFFDTAERGLLSGSLNDSGLRVILRARFSAGKNRGSTTLKLRSTGVLDGSLKTDDAADAKREIDFAFGGQPLDSYAIDSKQDRDQIEDALTGGRPLRGIFSDAQEACIKQFVGKHFAWAELRVFGPVLQVEVWDGVSIAGLARTVTLEQWGLPAVGLRPARQLLELSVRAADDEQLAVVNEIRQALEQHGIQASASETKTKTVLDHFAPGRKAP